MQHEKSVKHAKMRCHQIKKKASVASQNTAEHNDFDLPT